MKAMKTAIAITERLLDLVTMSLFLVLLFVGMYAFYDANHVVSSGELGDDVLAVAPTEEHDDFSLEEMRKINKDIIGWIKIKDTHIDYPILQGKDNSEYLVRNYKGEYATMGSVFADYHHNKLNDSFTVIYAHRMKDGLMFSDVTNYSDQNFFGSHLEGKVYTESKKYDLHVVGFAAVNVASTDIYNIGSYKNNSFAAYSTLKSSFEHVSNIAVLPGDKLMMLSTCDSDARYKRDVLLVKLEEAK